jgi:FkbM family methyltransferase
VSVIYGPALRRIAASMLTCVPPGVKRNVLRRAALAPPLVKTRTFERLFARMSDSGIYKEQPIETNFGLSPHLRCQVPLRKTQYAFGRPENSVMERGAIALANELSKDCLHFLDVGAHEGIFTFSVFHAIGKDITLHWFEPDDVIASRLYNNLQRNSVAARANRVAVADHDGCATFFRNLTDDSSGSLEPHFQQKHSTQSEAVKTVRLSDYIGGQGVSRAMLKVDVEGAAVQERFRAISYLLIEMLAPEIEHQLPARIIQETGWSGYYIRDFDLLESRDGKFTYVEPFWNWLFCNLDPSALTDRLSNTGFRVISAV